MSDQPQPRKTIEMIPIEKGESRIDLPDGYQPLSIQPGPAGTLLLQVQLDPDAPRTPRTFWLEDELDHRGQFVVHGKRFDLFEDRS